VTVSDVPDSLTDYSEGFTDIGERSRVRAKREHLARFYGVLPESRGQHLALTVLYVPDSLTEEALLGEKGSPYKD